jgi:pimeloyl-ACP methyl ester carboxylesterase
MNETQKDKPQAQGSKAEDSKLQGLGRVTTEAVLAITEIVESLHKRIDPLSSVFSKSDKEQLSGISGLVYRNIRNVTELVGKGIDLPLAALGKTLSSQEHSPGNQALLSALNGVLGDHLHHRDNPLAIACQFRVDGQVLGELELAEMIKKSNGKLLIMVHGLCMNDIQWSREEHDHGATLAKEAGMTALYLHYNTGRHISDNGKLFANLLESLVALSDQQLEINILAHSMGGLVSRSAYHIAKNNEHRWPETLKKLIFLGTPHHGAPLEKTGNWIDLILGANSYTVPFARLVKIRSAGITDLRYGNVQDSDRDTTKRFEFIGDQRSPLPLPSNVQCFAVATSAGSTEKHILGDGLVPMKSALGEHDDLAFDLRIPEHRRWTGNNINHMQLLSEQRVYQVLRSWFELQ